MNIDKYERKVGRTAMSSRSQTGWACKLHPIKLWLFFLFQERWELLAVSRGSDVIACTF
jgi:hypothetical protein